MKKKNLYTTKTYVTFTATTLCQNERKKYETQDISFVNPTYLIYR